MHARALLVALTCFAVSACAGRRLPGTGSDRASGQSSLMGKTYAGQNACNPNNHDRPFVIEWDATDMSIFEGRAATDVVFVRYEGCDLRVLDGCANDSVRGALGAYRPVEWTSGSVEKVDISDEAELYAKLPLGVATLGGRVKGGEKFRMEYFVSGVRTATRSAVYESELAPIGGCKGATHFVYGYSLGAFALASEKRLSGGVGADAKLVGAGASSVSSSNAEKKGGVLESCRTSSAKEVRSCQVPIRLLLRRIEGGKNPDAPAGVASAPPTRSDHPEITMEETKLRESAARKRLLKDGKGCLADLDEADREFPNSARLSTRPDGMMNIRGVCLMLTGECETGKKLLSRAYEQLGLAPDQIDRMIQVEADQSCPK